MGKQRLHFEWQVGEEEWQTNQAAGKAEEVRLPQPAKAKHWPVRWYLAIVTIVLCGLGAGGWLWYTAQSGLVAIQEELRTAIRLEMWAVAQGEFQMAAGLADEQAGRAWQKYFEQEVVQVEMIMKMDGPEAERLLELQLLALQADVALVHVITTSQRGEQAYRQTRFYRRTVEGWQRTAPDERLWGSPARLESSYFVFEYRQHDAAAVAKAAPQLDRLYTTLSENFGWSRLPLVKVRVKVEVVQPPGPSHMSLDHSLRIASPALYLASSEMTDDQLLAQSIALPLLDYMLGHVNVLPTWQPMLDGLRLWQLWEMNLPLSAWQDEVVAWVYVDAPRAKAGQPPVLPEWYLPLCVTHSLWVESPIRLQIPLLCDSAARSEWAIILRHLHSPLTQLGGLGVPVVWKAEQPDLQKVMPNLNHAGRAVALAMLVEYAMKTYGCDRLPFLLAALDQHDSWDTVLPAVFGISYSEFEKGWQSYLATQDLSTK